MPRLTADAKAALERHTPAVLKPSQHLSEPERKAWRTFVGACPAGHLTERDRPLVETWVTLTVAVRKLADVVAAADGEQLVDKDGPAARAMDRTTVIAKTLAGISNRLKIAPLATHSAPHKAASRKAPAQGEQPTRGLVRVQ